MRTSWSLVSVLCSLSVAGCGALGQLDDPPAKDDPLLSSAESEVVYGTDNREDVYAHPDATLRLRAQQATVALMSPGVINLTNPNNVTFNAPRLQDDLSLCPTERFLDDPTPAFCSGTLIDDDLVLTAGHCITSAAACTGTRFVFKFYRPSATTIETITTEDIFQCTQIVARQQGTVGGRNLDYAVVRIDRAATPRFTPAPIRPGNAPLTVGQNITVIGSGSGIPFKIDSGGTVRDPRAATVDFFEATTDTFGGNSGSGIYEMTNYTVTGILVRGEQDYVSNGTCNIVNVCGEDECSGEDSTYVRPAIDHYCTASFSTRLGCPPPNDFTLALNPTSRDIIAGQSATYTVQTTVVSGTAQNIALTITGLPTGVTGSFNPATILAGQSSTLTLNVAATVPTGLVRFSVRGASPQANRYAQGTANITNTNQLPVVAITSPANGSTVSGATVAVAATATDADGTVAGVRFDLPDGTSVNDTAAPYETTWSSLTVPDGSHVIRATATDNLGFTSQTTVTINVENGISNCTNGTFNSVDVPKAIPDNNTAGVFSNLGVGGNGVITTLSLSLNITHTWRGDLRVTLLSPGGTPFVVFDGVPNDSNPNVIITNQAITSFNNTPSGGVWRLQVQDRAAQDTGTLTSWSLNVVSFCEPPPTGWSGSASPFVPLVDNGQVCSSLTVTGAGQASAAKLNVNGRHDARQKLRGTLSHNGITVPAFPVKTFPNGFGTFTLTNRPVPGITGSATGVWTLCIIDTDAFGDTGVLKTWAVHD